MTGIMLTFDLSRFVDRDMLMRFIGWAVGHWGLLDRTWSDRMVAEILNMPNSSQTATTLAEIEDLPEHSRRWAPEDEEDPELLDGSGDEGDDDDDDAMDVDNESLLEYDM